MSLASRILGETHTCVVISKHTHTQSPLSPEDGTQEEPIFSLKGSISPTPFPRGCQFSLVEGGHGDMMESWKRHKGGEWTESGCLDEWTGGGIAGRISSLYSSQSWQPLLSSVGEDIRPP